jgi:hypothetical protein
MLYSEIVGACNLLILFTFGINLVAIWKKPYYDRVMNVIIHYYSSTGNSAKKDKTPFVLAQPMPFP